MAIAQTVAAVIRDAIKQAAKNLTDKYDLPGLKAEIATFPKAIELQEKQVIACKFTLDEALEAKAQEEAILMSLIAGETNSQGKPTFSNKEARDAELIQRKKTSPAYIEAEKAAQNAERAYLLAQAELRRLQDEFRAKRIIARIVCKELAAIGLDNEEEEENDS